MAEDKSVRVVVKINPSRHPELFEALEEIESSGRAERLRSLALMALSGYSTSGEGGQPEPRSRKNEKAKPKAESRGKSKDDGSTVKQDTGESHSDRAAANETPTDAAPSETEEDPHKEVRASIVKGMKSVGF